MESKKRKRADKAEQKPKGGKKRVPGKVARAPEKAREKASKKGKITVTKPEKKEPKYAKERRLAAKVLSLSLRGRCLRIVCVFVCVVWVVCFSSACSLASLVCYIFRTNCE